MNILVGSSKVHLMEDYVNTLREVLNLLETLFSHY